MSSDSDRSIKLYHYTGSPYAKKIVWYLALRQLPYAEVLQPVIMPRPDLEAIGVGYRRIPILTVGKDVYCDTRIILQKLEQLFPDGNIGAPTSDGQALQQLLSIWHTEGPLFFKGVGSMPLSLFSDPTFAKDRAQMTGRPWNIEAMEAVQPEAYIYVQSAFVFFESLLSDGREWIVGTKQPSLADIEGIFVVHWVSSTKGALPEDLISKTKFPKTYAWIGRFDDAVKSAQAGPTKPEKLDGATAAKQILASDFAEPEGSIPGGEPQRSLRKGEPVEVFPLDTGMNNKDRGALVSLAHDEIVIALDNGLRLHTPRSNFRVRATGTKI